MILAVLQARVSSSRLPGKVLRQLLGQPMLLRQIERIHRCTAIDKLVVATSTDASDVPLVDACATWGVDCYRGPLDDVLARFVQAAAPYAPEAVVRLTGDCPLIDWTVVDAVIDLYRSSHCDYASNVDPPTYPDGLDVEVIRWSALQEAATEALLPSEREHVTPFIRAHPDRYRRVNMRAPIDLSQLRLTVDEPADFAAVERIYGHLYPANPAFGTDDVLALLRARPDLIVNGYITRNQGFLKSLEADRPFYASAPRGTEQ